MIGGEQNKHPKNETIPPCRALRSEYALHMKSGPSPYGEGPDVYWPAFSGRRFRVVVKSKGPTGGMLIILRVLILLAFDPFRILFRGDFPHDHP